MVTFGSQNSSQDNYDLVDTPYKKYLTKPLANGGIVSNNQGSGAGTTIPAPTRTSLGDGYSMVKATGAIPDFNPVYYNPIETKTSQGITNQLGQDYFDNIYNQAAKRTSDKYFGNTDSIQNRLTQQLNQRGLIGGGIEQGATSDLFKSFGGDLASIESDLAQQQARAAQDVAFKNADISQFNTSQQNTIASQNAQNKSNIDLKNQDYQGFLSELGLSAAGDEARTINDFNKDIFKSTVDLETEKYKTEKQFLSDIISQLNDALGNKLIDPETRDVLEGIFASNIAGNIGTPETQQSFRDNANNAASKLSQNQLPPTSQSRQWYEPGRGWTYDGVYFQNNAYENVPRR